MSSRQSGGGGANNNQNNRPRSRAGFDDSSAWPPRLPPMRALPPLRDITQRAHDSDTFSQSVTAPSSSTHQRIPYMSTNAAIRAERIRNIHAMERLTQQSMDDGSDRSPSLWFATRWGHDRRGSTDRHGTNNSHGERDYSIDELDEANSHLRALLELTDHPPMPPRTAPNSSITLDPSSVRVSFTPTNFRSNELPDDSNRRNKRRKIDAERQLSNFKGFRYGKYGQLEPGQLQMEIVSCDGGMYSGPYSAENILKDDEDKVYCTKGNRCNIVLRHQGGSAFTLQELVIKAPASMNYSHPVREGMVFITMEQDEALNRTARYQVQYTEEATSEPATCPHMAAHNEDSTRANAHPFSQAFDRELRRVITQRRRRTGGPDPGPSSRRFQYPLLDSDEDDDDPMSTSIHTDYHQRRPTQHNRRSATTTRRPSMPSEFSSNHPDFQITTECSDDEDDLNTPGHSAFSRRSNRPPPYRIGSLPFETPDSDAESNPNEISIPNPYTNSNMSSASLLEAWEAHDRATQEAVRAVGGGQLLVPHARFFIEKRKSKCTIRFDPPVSGRFILLKMWSSHHEPGGNIDIQTVQARGFAGPRYFPSVELR